LRQTALETIKSTTVFFEPGAEDDVLMNSCFALYSPEIERGGN
jgi:tungstate transport system substrate-binding protein